MTGVGVVAGLGVLLILTGSLLLIQKKSEINSHSGEAR